MQSSPELTPRGEHLAFLEVLGSMRADDARWTPTMAGFVTVRLVDKWAESLRGWLVPRPSEVAAVRSAIDKVAAGAVYLHSGMKPAATPPRMTIFVASPLGHSIALLRTFTCPV
jgi:hypothetical protein